MSKDVAATRSKKTVSIRLTLEELWELSTIFSAGYEDGPGNEIAARVSDKLSKAFLSVRPPKDLKEHTNR